MSARVRTVIVDDEPLARESIRLLLAGDPEVDLVAECSGIDAPAVIAASSPDLLFLDVQMPERNGFEVLDSLSGASMPAVVFVTAYDAYAVRAFDVHALDYLLKPFTDARFGETLRRVKQHLRGPQSLETAGRIVAMLEARNPEREWARRFLVRVRDRSVVVRSDEIDWIEAADYYVSLHVGGRTYLMRQTMSELAATLDPQQFLRVHRSAIVNVDRVREILPLFRGDSALLLADGTRLKLSRTRREEFERLFARR